MNTTVTAPNLNPEIELPKPGTAVALDDRDLGRPKTILDIIDRAASNPAFDPEKFNTLTAWHNHERKLELLGTFNDAMHAAQAGMKKVIADQTNPQTRSKYASYAALDEAIRDQYIAAGLSVSYNTADCPLPNHVRTLAKVSCGQHTEVFQYDSPIVTTGFKGGEMMTLTHATASAHSYGKRYLLTDIFNLAIDHDDDGNAAGGNGTISDEQVQTINNLIAETEADLARFCGYMGVATVADITIKQFSKAIVALEEKRTGKKVTKKRGRK